MRIRHADPTAGFCAIITYALNGIRFAESQNLLPLVDYSNNEVNSYFYQPDYGDNIWEYYFEPVTQFSSGMVKENIEIGLIQPSFIKERSIRVKLREHIHDPNRISTFWGPKRPANVAEWMEEKRNLGRYYIQKYVKPKISITNKVQRFYENSMKESKVCGLHIRGTDFAYAHPTPIEKYIEAIKKLEASQNSKFDKYFIATDQQQFLDEFKQIFGANKIISYVALRSSSASPVFQDSRIDGFKKGEDVLIDILLLSKCNFIIKGAASVGEYALWFNPNLKCVDLALDSRFDLTTSSTAFFKLNVGKQSQLQNAYPRFISLSIYWTRLFKYHVRELLIKLGWTRLLK